MFSKKIKVLSFTTIILFLCLLTMFSFLDSSTLNSTLISDTRYAQPSQQSGTGTFKSSDAIYKYLGFSLYIPGIVTTSIYYKDDNNKDAAGVYRGNNGGKSLWSDLLASKNGSAHRFRVETFSGNSREMWYSNYCKNIDGTWSWVNYKILLNPAYFNPDSPVKGRSLLDNAFLEPGVDTTALKAWLASGSGTGWINAILSARPHYTTPYHSDMYANRLWSDGSGNYTKPGQIFTTSTTLYANTNLDQLSYIIDNDYDNGYTFPTFTELQSAPSVTTGDPSNVTATTADVSGSVTGLGVPNPTEHGFVWSTSANPTTASSKINLGAKDAVGGFSTVLTGLSAGSTYHVRAYATNTVDTAYGEDKTFNFGRLPAVTTGLASNILGTTATVGGEVTDAGIPNITQYGHVWSTSVNPTMANNKTTLGAKTSIGTYSSNLTGLSGGTTYYVRAYATNSSDNIYDNTDTVYGNQITITTIPAPIVNLTSPTNGTLNYSINGYTLTFPTIAIRATGTNTTQIRGLVNGNVKSATASTSYSYDWVPSAGGTYAIKAQGMNAGFGWTDSNTRTVILEPGDPTVTITSPVDGADFYLGDTITVNATGINCSNMIGYYKPVSGTDTQISKLYSNTYSGTFQPTVAGDYIITVKGNNTPDPSDPGAQTYTKTITISVINPFDGSSASNDLRIYSVRDLAWKSKYVGAYNNYLGSTPLNQFPVSTYINNYIKHYIKSGYAVDFKMNTKDISDTKKPKEIKVDVKFYTTNLDGTGRSASPVNLYTKSSTGVLTPLTTKYKSLTIDRSSKKSDANNYFSKYASWLGSNKIEWGWSYYLPSAVYLNGASLDSKLIAVNFTITLNTYDGKSYVFNNSTFSYPYGSWGGVNGDVFRYDPNHSLLEDINNSTTH